MAAWLSKWLRALRTCLLIRFGLWRGHWRRGRITLGGASVYLNPLRRGTWTFGLYCPPGLRDDESAPLVIVLHGCRQRALGFAQASGWVRFADSAGVRLLCPDQRRRVNLWRCWNWFHPLAQRGAGELIVVLQMIDDTAKRVRVEPAAIAAVGISAGGAMAALLAFHHADRVRAAVAVAAPPLLGTLGLSDAIQVLRRGLLAAPERALGSLERACAPLAVIHGSADTTVHPRCAEQLVAQALDSCRRDGLEPRIVEVRSNDAATSMNDYRVEGSVRVRSIRIEGLGHVWSGGPGGHPYCVDGGPPLTAMSERFLRDIGLLRRGRLRDDAQPPGLGSNSANS